jgi:hypothetical protein
VGSQQAGCACCSPFPMAAAGMADRGLRIQQGQKRKL